jgi:hypothetical protein
VVTALVAGAVLLAASFTAAALMARVGARPLLLAGGAASAGGTYWLSRITEHSTYAGGLLGPMLVTGAGLGLLFAYARALAAGFDRAFLVAAGIALLILVVAIAMIRVRRADLSGA